MITITIIIITTLELADMDMPLDCTSHLHPRSSRTLMWLSTIFLRSDWREYDDLRPITSSHRVEALEGNYF
jgi:hypothetical protein